MLTQIITELNLNLNNYIIKRGEIDGCLNTASTEFGEILTTGEKFIPKEWQELIDEKKFDTLYERLLTKEINYLLIDKIEKEMDDEELDEIFVSHFIQHLLDTYQTGEVIMSFDEDLQNFFENEKELLTGIKIQIKHLVKSYKIVERFTYKIF